MLICKSCNTKNNDNNDYCSNCGKILKFPKVYIVLIIGLLFWPVLIIGIYMLYKDIKKLREIKKTNNINKTELIKNSSKKQNISKNSYIIVDIETTGLSVYHDEIVELSALKILNDEVVDTFNTLVKPYGRMSKRASEINNITDDMLKNSPKINEILQDFINFCDNLPLVAHNADFDLSFICRDCRIYNIDFNPKYIDTLPIARRELILNNYRLDTIAKYFYIEQNEQHRALSDCHTLFECYKQMNINPKPVKYFFNVDMENVNIKIDESKITATQEIKTSIFTNKGCVITGNLEKYGRLQAMQIIANLGGICQKNITKQTNYLIVGSEAGQTKLNKAKEKIAKGQDLQIIPEDEFYKLIEECKANE